MDRENRHPLISPAAAARYPVAVYRNRALGGLLSPVSQLTSEVSSTSSSIIGDYALDGSVREPRRVRHLPQRPHSHGYVRADQVTHPQHHPMNTSLPHHVRHSLDKSVLSPVSASFHHNHNVSCPAKAVPQGQSHTRTLTPRLMYLKEPARHSSMVLDRSSNAVHRRQSQDDHVRYVRDMASDYHNRETAHKRMTFEGGHREQSLSRPIHVSHRNGVDQSTGRYVQASAQSSAIHNDARVEFVDNDSSLQEDSLSCIQNQVAQVTRSREWDRNTPVGRMSRLGMKQLGHTVQVSDMSAESVLRGADNFRDSSAPDVDLTLVKDEPCSDDDDVRTLDSPHGLVRNMTSNRSCGSFVPDRHSNISISSNANHHNNRSISSGKQVENRNMNDSTPDENQATVIKMWTIIYSRGQPATTARIVGFPKGGGQLRKSTVIEKRISRDTLLTASGKTYLLEGPLDAVTSKNLGINDRIITAFKNGFPEDWKNLLEEWAGSSESEDENINDFGETEETENFDDFGEAEENENAVFFQNEDEEFDFDVVPAHTLDNVVVPEKRKNNKTKSAKINSKQKDTKAKLYKNNDKSESSNAEKSSQKKDNRSHKGKKFEDDSKGLKSSKKKINSSVAEEKDDSKGLKSSRKKGNSSVAEEKEDSKGLKSSEKKENISVAKEKADQKQSKKFKSDNTKNKKMEEKDQSATSKKSSKNKAAKEKVNEKDKPNRSGKKNGSDAMGTLNQEKEKTPAQKKMHRDKIEEEFIASPEPLSIERLPRTSSGRRVKPVLAWWAGQRVFCQGDVVEIVCDASKEALKKEKVSILDFEVTPKGKAFFSGNLRQQHLKKSVDKHRRKTGGVASNDTSRETLNTTCEDQPNTPAETDSKSFLQLPLQDANASEHYPGADLSEKDDLEIASALFSPPGRRTRSVVDSLPEKTTLLSPPGRRRRNITHSLPEKTERNVKTSSDAVGNVRNRSGTAGKTHTLDETSEVTVQAVVHATFEQDQKVKIRNDLSIGSESEGQARQVMDEKLNKSRRHTRSKTRSSEVFSCQESQLSTDDASDSCAVPSRMPVKLKRGARKKYMERKMQAIDSSATAEVEAQEKALRKTRIKCRPSRYVSATETEIESSTADDGDTSQATILASSSPKNSKLRKCGVTLKKLPADVFSSKTDSDRQNKLSRKRRRISRSSHEGDDNLGFQQKTVPKEMKRLRRSRSNAEEQDYQFSD